MIVSFVTPRVGTAGRDDVAANLNQAGIDTGMHYPIALPYLAVYADGYQPSPLVLLAAIATRTKRLKLGAGAS